jgi:signal transduction histidine kinase
MGMKGRLAAYGFAALTVGLALAARASLDAVLGYHQAFAQFYIAIGLSAWFGGLGPSVAAALAGYVLGVSVFGSPDASMMPADPFHWARRGMYLSVASTIVLLAASMRRARHQAEAHREEARERAEMLDTINRVGRTLSTGLGLENLVQALTDATTELTGARFGAFFHNRVDDRGEYYLLSALAGASRDDFAGFSPPRNTPLFAQTFSGRGTVRLDDVTTDPRYGQTAPYYGTPPGHVRVRSYLAIPVGSRSGAIVGGLFFGHPEAGVFTEWHERLVIGLAAQAAVAIDNSQLYDAERKARAEAEAAQRRLGFLAQASALLSSSLDYSTTLDHVAQLAVSILADYCVIDIFTDDGSMERVATAHADPAKIPLVERLRNFSATPYLTQRVATVIRTGEPDVMTDLDPERAAATFDDPFRRETLLALGPRGYMVVPLRVRGRTLGTMTFVSAESGRRYEEDDLALARELGERAAVAVDNARVHEAEHVARAEAEAVNSAKDQFLSLVSHELRTPLTSILGWLRVLRTGKSDRTGRALDVIERSVRVQTKLTEDLLDVSRMVTGRFRLDVAPVDIAATVRAAVDAIRPEAGAKGVRVEVEIHVAPHPIPGDPERLQQVVSNLLGNAVKFTPEGGLIDVRLDDVDAAVRLVVRDTGKGIDPDFRPHIFERFRQADHVASREKGGLGLGLAIARHLIELHGGRISGESEGTGKGATFTVVLPRVAHEARELHPA